MFWNQGLEELTWVSLSYLINDSPYTPDPKTNPNVGPSHTHIDYLYYMAKHALKMLYYERRNRIIRVN